MEIRTATHTLAELKDIAQEIIMAVRAKADESMGVHEVAIDVSSNAVVVGVDPTLIEGTEMPAAFRERWGNAPIELRSALRPWPASLGSDPNAPPISGGHGYGPKNSPTCTAGFRVIVGEESRRYMLTAGHCLNSVALGTQRFHRDVVIGTTSLWDYGGNKDFGIVKLSANDRMRKMVIVDGQRRAVRGTNTSYSQGVIRCWTGQKSDRSRCGTIVNSTWSGEYSDGKQMSDIVILDVACLVGDSGSPVYRYVETEGVWANGILSACSSTHTWYVRWTNIRAAWGVRIDVY
jgi:hypothetical protein